VVSLPDGSHDTVQALQHLLEQAQRGEIIGIAFAAACRRRKVLLDTTGEAYRNPTYARGMVAALDDAIGIRMRE
jgi:hypothetical protein